REAVVNDELAALHAEALLETLFWEGRMIAPSKSGYLRANPEHVPIWNANVCVADGKLWFGDLCLTCDRQLLLELAVGVGERIFVLHEHDGRFANEESPLLERAVYSVDENGDERFDERRIERRPDGSLRRRRPHRLIGRIRAVEDGS